MRRSRFEEQFMGRRREKMGKSEAFFHEGKPEELRLENEMLSVVILPQLGGKVSSVYFKPQAFELAAPNTRGGAIIFRGRMRIFHSMTLPDWTTRFPILTRQKWSGMGKRCAIRIMARSGAIRSG